MADDAGDPPRSVMIASEPLTTDASRWLEVPEYSMLTAELTPEGMEFETRDLDSDREAVDFLATVPLLEGGEEADLVQLARVMRRRIVPAGEILWRQGDDAQEILFVVEGAVSASLTCPGDRTVEIGSAGPGDVLGEIGLLDGGGTR